MSWIPETPSELESTTDLSRVEIITKLCSGEQCDVLIMGGGIHGVAFAYQAALSGLKTILLEQSDFASETSSRSSKMAHGGLRYLEQFDFKQVYEGIQAREELFAIAPHLVKLSKFLIPIRPGEFFTRHKLGFGLALYDAMHGQRNRYHRWHKSGDSILSAFGEQGRKLTGCFSYGDGLLDDSRLVLELMVAAVQEGAYCLNYARVDETVSGSQGGTTVLWRDQLTGKRYDLRAGIVVNCAGPWASYRGTKLDPTLSQQLRYSRGTHLIFGVPWPYPSLFLPLGGRGRYYFVWPHYSGTMVGTTESPVDGPISDPEPSQNEIQEILDRLKRDLPDSRLDRSTLHYAFAGVRTLPLRGHSGSAATSRLSRRHIWHYDRGVLSLLGGKLTTALSTAAEGLSKVYELSELTPPERVTPRPLQGAVGFDHEVPRFRERAQQYEISKEIIEATIRRLGAEVRFFFEAEQGEERARGFEIVGGVVLRGELERAIKYEYACTLEDLMRRRLGLEYEVGHGISALTAIAAVLKEFCPEIDVATQIAGYTDRMLRLHKLMGVEIERLGAHSSPA